MDISPPNRRLAPVCNSSLIGCSITMGDGGSGCDLCHSASALSNLAGSVFSNHHLRMANSSSRSQADLPKRISPFLRATGSAPEIRAAQCCCFLVVTAQSAQMLRQQQSKILDGIGSPQNCGERHTQSNCLLHLKLSNAVFDVV